MAAAKQFSRRKHVHKSRGCQHSGSLILFLGLEVTACQGLVALVALDFIFRGLTAAAAKEVLLPLLNSDLFNLVLVLLTGI